MESLLANYASSDEEEEEQEHQPQKPIPVPVAAVPSKTTSSSSSNRTSSLFSSLPQPKSSSLFESLPEPKQPSINPSTSSDETDTQKNVGVSSKFSEINSLFSSLPKPKPKSQILEQPVTIKKVVQFKPPIIPLPKSSELDDGEEEEEEEDKRRRKLESLTQTPSVKSFLSTIPAPRNTATLGVQSSSGSGRRSIVETEAPSPASASNSGGSAVRSDVPVDQNAGNYESYTNYQYGSDQNQGQGYFMDDASYGNYSSGIDQSVGVQAEATCYYENNASYGDYGQYGNNWVDGSEASGVSDNELKFPGKRGRREIPSEVIEVKQEDLIKNRPREDQVKLTGIAFGPAYQPVSAKGKPSKLHKRKHQIGSLFFDMKQKEMELAERRAKGTLTKAETQAKYGW